MRARRALALAVALLVPAAPASAKSFTLPEARIQVRVAKDGAVLVREQITFDYDGSFTGAFRDIPLRDGERIDRVKVSEPGRPFVPGGSVELGTEGPPYQFGAKRVGDLMRIVWRYRAADERRTWDIAYRITGLARAYDDVVDVNLQVWGNTWQTPLGSLLAVMHAPGHVSAENARVFGHPVTVRGDTAFGDGVARLRAFGVPARA